VFEVSAVEFREEDGEGGSGGKKKGSSVWGRVKGGAGGADGAAGKWVGLCTGAAGCAADLIVAGWNEKNERVAILGQTGGGIGICGMAWHAAWHMAYGLHPAQFSAHSAICHTVHRKHLSHGSWRTVAHGYATQSTHGTWHGMAWHVHFRFLLALVPLSTNVFLAGILALAPCTFHLVRCTWRTMLHLARHGACHMPHARHVTADRPPDDARVRHGDAMGRKVQGIAILCDIHTASYSCYF
jgi:hypothetical protein